MRWAEVIGDPVAHSKSPAIHRFWLARLGLSGDYRATRVTAADLPAWLDARRADAGWAGANVTMPLKEVVLPLLDGLSDDAALIGAANCVVRDGTRLIGHNSDVDGVAGPLRQWPPLHVTGGHLATYVQLIGAGGAARAAALGASRAGYGDFDIYNRNRDRAVELAAWLSLKPTYAHGLEALGPLRRPDEAPADQQFSHVIINASPMGMHGFDPVPIRLADYYPDTIVFDMVYHPLETPLLVEARRLGLRTIDGLDMLVGQAARAFELFFGVKAPRDADGALRALLVAGS